jgi:competence protein ComEC
MKNYPVIALTLFFASGIAISPHLRLHYYFLLPVSLLLLVTAIIYFIIKNESLKSILTILIYITVFTAGLFYYIPSSVFPFKKELHKEEVVLYGVIKDINISGKDETRFTLHSDSLIFNYNAVHLKNDFYCVLRNDSLQLFPGYKISFNGIFYKGKNIRNPGGFEYEGYLQRAGITGYIYSSSDSAICIIEDNEALFSGVIYRIRKYISESIDDLHNKNTASLLKGILLADRKDIDSEIRTDFINSGTAHILAVSGLHVGFIILIFIVLTGRLNLYLRSILTLSGIIIFIFITGSPPSVVRASLMAVFVIVGFLTNRSTNIFNSLALSALIILLLDPSQLFNPGFQLSYAAVIGIAIFYLPVRPKIIESNIKGDFLKNTLHFSAVTVAAQIGTLPLVLYYFSKLSLVSFAANLIVVPLIGMIISTAFITLLITPINYIAEVFAAANEMMSSLLFYSVNVTGNTAYSFLWVHDFSTADCIISYSLIIIFIFSARIMNTRTAKIVLAVLLLSSAVLLTELDNKQLMKDGCLNCYMIDVGQGDAILLRFPSGKTALIDAGETTAYFDTGEKIIEPLLNYLGIKKIDYAFVSHLDADHYSGFVHLIKKGYINYLYKPSPDTTSKEKKFEKFLAEEGVDFSYYSGDELKIDKTRIYVLDNEGIRAPRSNNNDFSGVLLLVYGETSFLFTGDAGFKAEEVYINKYGDMLKSNVLKVSHHGSATATSDKFLNFTKPEISLISTGEKNKFGHPSKKTLDRLSMIETEIYRTDEEGGILLRSDGYTVSKINWKQK